MKVKELIKELQQLDGDRIVVMQKDGEGNGYSPLDEIGEGSYKADSTWFGEFGLEELTPELEDAGYSEEDVVHGKKAIVLIPVN